MNKVRSMKKMLALMLVFAIILCFSGCIRYKTTATVHKDGTADITMLYAVVDMSDMMDDDGDEDDDEDEDENNENAETMAELEDAGWEVEEYTGEKGDEQKYVGYTATKEGIALEDLADELAVFGEGFADFTCEKDGDVWILEWDATSSSEEAKENNIDAKSLKSYGGYMMFVLELPNKAEDSNATNEDGKTLEWDLFDLEEPIHAEFKLTGGGFPMWIIGVIIGGVIIAAGIVVAIILISKKKKDAPAPAYAAPAAAAPVAPQAPVAPAPAFTPSQSTGLPQVGAVPQAPAAPAPFAQPVAPAVDQAPTASAPVWNQPSAAGQVDSLEELEALEEEPAKPIVPDILPPNDQI